MEFKFAQREDAPQIAHLVNLAYRGDYAKQGWTTESELLGGQRTDSESIEEILSTPHQMIMLVLDSESKKLLGSVHLIKEANGTLYFGMLTVEPTLQNQGLGKKIIAEIERFAQKIQCSRIRFTVIPVRQELIQFYERRGYQATGHFEEFPTHDPRFGLPKVEGLILKEFAKDLKP